MAVAKLVCGDCNAVIAPTDAFCPSCGAKIERGDGAPSPRTCPVCGHRNIAGAEFCASCGSRLGTGEGAPAVRQAKADQRAPQKQPQKKKTGSGAKFETWQIIAAVAVLGLVAYLVVTEISSERPLTVAQPPAATGTPANVPFLSAPAATIDIAPLEQAVKAAPNDPAALLKLANALHDDRMLPRAIDTYKKYLGIRPKDPDARTDLGICYFQLAQTDTMNSVNLLETAAQEILLANTGSPKHQPSAFNLGVVYLHMQNLEESNKWFQRTIELNKDSDLGKRAQNILNQHSSPPPLQ